MRDVVRDAVNCVLVDLVSGPLVSVQSSRLLGFADLAFYCASSHEPRAGAC